MASPHVETVTDPIEVPLFNKQGQSIGTVNINPADFGGKISTRLMSEAVLMYEANTRAGTHSTLRRGEVAGSTKKLFRQKGTGNARAGTKRTNKRRGGGTSKGPKPRDYEYHLPKKALRAATRMAILAKLRDKEAIVIDDLTMSAIKTKEVATMLKALGLSETSCLISTAGIDAILHRSARNIEGVDVMPTTDLNTRFVLRRKRLVLTKAALDALLTKKEEA